MQLDEQQVQSPSGGREGAEGAEPLGPAGNLVRLAGAPRQKVGLGSVDGGAQMRRVGLSPGTSLPLRRQKAFPWRRVWWGCRQWAGKNPSCDPGERCQVTEWIRWWPGAGGVEDAGEEGRDLDITKRSLNCI